LALTIQDDDPIWQAQGARMELGRRYFVMTKKGYFGLGSPSVPDGDVLALLAESSCPWYLQK